MGGGGNIDVMRYTKKLNKTKCTKSLLFYIHYRRILKLSRI